jgi:hypothetical protein
MSAKRNSNSDQPDPPVQEPPHNTPGTVNAAPLPKGVKGESGSALRFRSHGGAGNSIH